jgi:energy-coupling factor transporter ATP-binding protein EcfA2
MIEVVDVSHHYRLKPVLRHVNLPVNSGEVVAIMGPNGTGKTTLMQIMAGLVATAAPLIGAVTSIAFARLGASAPLIIAAGVGVSLAILLIAPPSLRHWQLTGFHRRSPFKKDSLAHAQQRASYPSLARIWPG